MRESRMTAHTYRPETTAVTSRGTILLLSSLCVCVCVCVGLGLSVTPGHRGLRQPSLGSPGFVPGGCLELHNCLQIQVLGEQVAAIGRWGLAQRPLMLEYTGSIRVQRYVSCKTRDYTRDSGILWVYHREGTIILQIFIYIYIQSMINQPCIYIYIYLRTAKADQKIK